MEPFSYFNKKRIIIISSVVFVIAILPTILYFFKFYKEWNFNSGIFSSSKDDWGTFGDFIGGTLNTILNFVILLITVFSLYTSLKVSEKVHDDQIKIQILNIRPLPLLTIKREPAKFLIAIENKGLGPLRIKKLIFKKGKRKHSFFHYHIIEFINNDKYSERFFVNEHEKLVLSPGEMKTIFTFDLSNVDVEFNSFLEDFFASIAGIHMKIEFTDLVGSDFESISYVMRKLKIQ